jgi:HEAT repeat protein
MRPVNAFDPATLDDAALVRIALEDSDFRRARAAGHELAQRTASTQATVDAFASALAHTSSELPRRAAQVLALFGEKAAPAAKALIDACSDRRWTVREAVVQALAALTGLPVVRDALLQLSLHDRVAHVRAAAAAVLAGMHQHAQAVYALGKALEHPFPRVRCRAMQALVRFESLREALVPIFARSITDSHALIRRTAVEVLGGCGRPALTAVPSLLRRLSDGDRRVRLAASAVVTRLRTLLDAPAQMVLDRLGGTDSPEENLRACLRETALPDDLRQALLTACGGESADSTIPRQVWRVTVEVWAIVLRSSKEAID